MQNQHLPQDPRTLLSALWVFFLMNIIFRDIHQFLSPGYTDWVMAGEMFGREITDELLLYGGFAVEVMILMVIVPHILPRRAVRIANTVAVVFTAALVLFTPPIDPDDVFFLAVGLATLAATLWFGWTKFAPSDIPNGDSVSSHA
ncbi:MAG: DUF6326 family protein [Paracoccaceae bacterium]|nr:DUF6326 family protein [Paracoccaceae bacterium]